MTNGGRIAIFNRLDRKGSGLNWYLSSSICGRRTNSQTDIIYCKSECVWVAAVQHASLRISSSFLLAPIRIFRVNFGNCSFALSTTSAQFGRSNPHLMLFTIAYFMWPLSLFTRCASLRLAFALTPGVYFARSLFVLSFEILHALLAVVWKNVCFYFFKGLGWHTRIAALPICLNSVINFGSSIQPRGRARVRVNFLWVSSQTELTEHRKKTAPKPFSLDVFLPKCNL